MARRSWTTAGEGAAVDVDEQSLRDELNARADEGERVESDDERADVFGRPASSRPRKRRRDAGIARSVRVARPDVPAEPVTVAPWVSDVIHEALSVLVVAGSRLAGMEPDRAILLRLTPAEKEMLREPTTSVLAKYAGAVGPYQEELALALALLAVYASKIEALRAAPAVPPGTVQ